MARRVLDFKQIDDTGTGTSKEILVENCYRKYFLIQNHGDDRLWISFDKPAVIGEGICLNPKASYEPFCVPSNAIHVISEGTSQLSVIHGGS